MQINSDWLATAFFETTWFRNFINLSTVFVNSRHPVICEVVRHIKDVGSADISRSIIT